MDAMCNGSAFFMNQSAQTKSHNLNLVLTLSAQPEHILQKQEQKVM